MSGLPTPCHRQMPRGETCLDAPLVPVSRFCVLTHRCIGDTVKSLRGSGVRFQTVIFTLISALILFQTAGKAEEVALGYLSFDQLILGSPGSPGTNGFTIGNLTGDPTMGGNDLPPTWPVLTTVTFQSSSLDLVLADCTENCDQTFNLGDIAPQFFQSSDLQFPDTAAFSSAAFSATLDAIDFDLDGGGTFTAATDQISALLLPSSGDSLIAGTDSVLISVSDEASAPAPEPSTFFLLAPLLPFLYRKRRA